MKLTRIYGRAKELGVTVDVTQNSTVYGEIRFYAPDWHCFGFDGESHASFAGWGEGQPSCNRQECYEDIIERLSHGVVPCGCETCCDNAKQGYGLADDTPDDIVRDFAKERGDLPM